MTGDGLSVLTDYLKENGFGQIAELVEKQKRIYRLLLELEYERRGVDTEHKCACGCYSGAHCPNCELGHMLLLVGGEVESTRQYNSAHRQALGDNSIFYSARVPLKNDDLKKAMSMVTQMTRLGQEQGND